MGSDRLDKKTPDPVLLTMKYAGLDLAAKPTNISGLAILESTKDKPKITSLTNVYSDEQIIKTLKDVDYLAIGAPIINGSIPKGYREFENQLIGLGLRLMSPSLLNVLVNRAQKIISKLPQSIKVIEVHPRSSALMLGLNSNRPVFNQPRLKKLINNNNFGVANKHQFDALIAACTGSLHHKNRVRVIGENGSSISIPPSRNIKLAVFDMDGTLTKPTSSWEHIHRQLGTWENGGQKYLKKFLAGQISYEEFARYDTAEWKGLSFEKIKNIAQKVPYVSGAEQVMDHLRVAKIPVVVISGGLSVIADKIASDFGVKRIFVNDLIVEDGIVTGDIDIRVTFNGKLAIYKKLLKEYKLKPYQVMAVGDTFGDVPLFQNCGLAVAINPIKPEVSDYADYTFTDLSAIKELL